MKIQHNALTAKCLAGALVFVMAAWLVASFSPDNTSRNVDTTQERESAALVSPRLISMSPETITDLINAEQPDEGMTESFHASLPRSLSGAGQPAALTLSDEGKLKPDLNLRKLFDYYLTAIGEEPLAHIVARIRYSLAEQLTGDNYDRAIVILEDYLQYRNAIGEILEQQTSPVPGQTVATLDTVGAMKQSAAALRSNYFDEEVAAAFFNQQDALDDYLLQRNAIARDKTLAATEKSEQLAALDQATSADITSVHRRSRSVDELRARERTLRQNGAPQETLFALRENTVGTEAAERLAKLDESRRNWQNRMDSYRQELRVIEADGDYPEREKERLIGELRAQHFSPEELLRVQALDRIRNSER